MSVNTTPDTNTRYCNVLLLLAIPAMIMISISSHSMYGAAEWSMGWLFGGLINGAFRWGIPIVVMVYGACLLDSSRQWDTDTFVRRDITTLIIAAFFWLLVYELVTMGAFRNMGLIAGSPYNPRHFLFYLLGLHAITPTLRKFLPKTRARFLFAIVLCFLVSGFLSLGGGIPGVTQLAFFVSLVGYLLLGVFLHRFSLSKTATGLLIAAGLVGAAATVASIYAFSQLGWRWPMFMPWDINIVLMAVAIFLFVKITRLGRISFPHAPSIFFVSFIVHDFVFWELGRARNVIGGLAYRSFTFIPVMSVLVFVVCVVAALVWQFVLRKPVYTGAAFLWLKYKGLMETEPDSFDTCTARQYAHGFFVLFAVLFILLVAGPVYIAADGAYTLDMTVLAVFLLGCAVVSAGLAGVILVLRRPYAYFEALLMGVLLVVFINAFIFPIRAAEIPEIAAIAFPMLRNFIALTVAVVLAVKFRKRVRLAVAPILIMAVGLTGFTLWNIGNSDVLAGESPYRQEELMQSAATFSTGRNIVVIVMESLQGTIAEQALVDNPHLKEGFDGFTLFSHGFTSFYASSFSMVSILSGELYPGGECIDFQSHSYAALNDSFITDVQHEGVVATGLGLISFGWPPDFGEFPIPTMLKWSDVRTQEVYGYAIAASIARITGFWPDNPIGRRDGAGIRHWFLDSKLDSVAIHEALLERITVCDDYDRLLYFWDGTLYGLPTFSKDGNLILDHSVTTADETYFAFSQLIRLFDAMKELDVYDNSLIILVGDHGRRVLGEDTGEHLTRFGFSEGLGSYGNMLNVYRYNSAVFVKPPNAHGPAAITRDPIWIGDVRPIVNYYFFGEFDSTDPIEVVADIRAANPEVPVIFVPFNRRLGVLPSLYTTYHHIVYVSSLHDIPTAFAAR